MIEFTNIIDVKDQCTIDMYYANRQIKKLKRQINLLEKFVINDFIMRNPKRYDMIYESLQKKRRELIDAQKTSEWALTILQKIEFLKKVVIYYDSDVERLPISIRLKILPDSTNLNLEYIDDENYSSLPITIKFVTMYGKETFHGIIMRYYNDTSVWDTCGLQEFIKVLESEYNNFVCFNKEGDECE